MWAERALVPVVPFYDGDRLAPEEQLCRGFWWFFTVGARHHPHLRFCSVERRWGTSRPWQ